MLNTPIRNVMVSLGLLMTACCTQAATEIPFLERQLATADAVKIPVPTGFAPACDQDPQLAQRFTAMTPKTSRFLTCFIDEKKWKTVREGKSRDIHPLIMVTVQVPLPTGPFTPVEFEKLRAAAHKQLADKLQDTEAQQRVRSEQQRKLSEIGVGVTLKDATINLDGFFTPVGETLSFSFLASSSSVVSENGTTRQVTQVQANTTVYNLGNVLGFLVMDNTSQNDPSLTVREITSNWLQAYRALNEVPPSRY